MYTKKQREKALGSVLLTLLTIGGILEEVLELLYIEPTTQQTGLIWSLTTRIKCLFFAHDSLSSQSALQMDKIADPPNLRDLRDLSLFLENLQDTISEDIYLSSFPQRRISESEKVVFNNMCSVFIDTQSSLKQHLLQDAFDVHQF